MPRITRAALKEHKAKCEFVEDDWYGDNHVTIRGPEIDMPWGKAHPTTFAEVSDSTHCCGWAELGGFHSDEGGILLEKIIVIDELCKRQRRTKADDGHSCLIASVSAENDPQWRKALKYCGFTSVGRGPFVNAKTGNNVWLLQKRL